MGATECGTAGSLASQLYILVSPPSHFHESPISVGGWGDTKDQIKMLWPPNSSCNHTNLVGGDVLSSSKRILKRRQTSQSAVLVNSCISHLFELQYQKTQLKLDLATKGASLSVHLTEKPRCWSTLGTEGFVYLNNVTESCPPFLNICFSLCWLLFVEGLSYLAQLPGPGLPLLSSKST